MFLLNRISRRLLNKQTINYCDLFIGINNNKNKLVLLDIGAASGLQRRWKIFEKHIRPILVEPEIKTYNIESNLLYLSQSLTRVEDQLSSKEQRYRDDFARLQQTMSSLNDQMGSLSMFLGGSGGYY